MAHENAASLCRLLGQRHSSQKPQFQQAAHAGSEIQLCSRTRRLLSVYGRRRLALCGLSQEAVHRCGCPARAVFWRRMYEPGRAGEGAAQRVSVVRFAVCEQGGDLDEPGDGDYLSVGLCDCEAIVVLQTSPNVMLVQDCID